MVHSNELPPLWFNPAMERSSVMRRRVFVTGLGAVTAVGLGAEALWAAARAGRSAIGPLDLDRPVRNNIRIGAQLKGFDPGAHIDATVLPFCDRFTQFALVAG